MNRKKQTKQLAPKTIIGTDADYANVLGGIVELFERARHAAARAVNSVMTATYWEIGRRIVEVEQGGEVRAGYGEQLIEKLSQDLTTRLGKGFGRRNLFQMRAFYLAWPDVVQQPRRVIGTASSLRAAVGADKAIIVALSGWGDPAAKKAERLSMDLRILSLEEALDLIVPDKWVMCPKCSLDCIVMDQDGFITSSDQLIIWWLAGQCRHCSHARIYCQDCGTKFYLDLGHRIHCYCGYEWTVDEFGIGIEA